MGRLRKVLSKKIKQLKGDQSQAEFSRKVGVGQATLNRILNCEQSVSLDLLERMCERLKIEVADLLKEDRQ